MVLGRGTNIFLAVILGITLLSGAFFHAVIPHRHSHSGGGEDASWNALHASLRSEEKKAIAALISVFAVFTLCVSALAISFPMFLPAYRIARRKPDRFALLLKRGVLPYRAFP